MDTPITCRCEHTCQLGSVHDIFDIFKIMTRVGAPAWIATGVAGEVVGKGKVVISFETSIKNQINKPLVSESTS